MLPPNIIIIVSTLPVDWEQVKAELNKLMLKHHIKTLHKETLHQQDRVL